MRHAILKTSMNENLALFQPSHSSMKDKRNEGHMVPHNTDKWMLRHCLLPCSWRKVALVTC